MVGMRYDVSSKSSNRILAYCRRVLKVKSNLNNYRNRNVATPAYTGLFLGYTL